MSQNDPEDAPRPTPGASGQGPQGHGPPGYGAYALQGWWGADPTQVGTQPGKRVGFAEAVRRFFARYAQFSGRASPSEFWWVALFMLLVSTVLAVLAVAGGAATAGPSGEPGGIFWAGMALLGLFGLATLVPGIAVTVRRLHDANFSGWLYLLSLVPGGNVALLVLLVLPSRVEGARFDR